MPDLFAKPIDIARAWIKSGDIGPNPERVVQRLSQAELKVLLKEATEGTVQYYAFLKRLSEFK